MLNFSASVKLKAHKLSKYSSSPVICSNLSLNKPVIYAFPHLKAIKFSVMYIIFFSVGVRHLHERMRTLYDSNLLGENVGVSVREELEEQEPIKTPASYKMQHSCHGKIIGSVFEMPIMVFVLATERSHFVSVTP